MRRALGSVMILLGVIGLAVGLIDWSAWQGAPPDEQAGESAPLEGPEVSDAQGIAEPPAAAQPSSPSDAPPAETPALPSSPDQAPPAESPEAPQTVQPEAPPADAPRDQAGQAEPAPEPPPAAEDGDAPLVSVVIEPARRTVSEDHGDVVFEIRLAAPSTRPIVVVFTTLDGSAKTGEDFARSRGAITFMPGDDAAEIRVPILDDEASEGAEDLEILLTVDPKVASLSARRVEVTIEDND